MILSIDHSRFFVCQLCNRINPIDKYDEIHEAIYLRCLFCGKKFGVS